MAVGIAAAVLLAVLLFARPGAEPQSPTPSATVAPAPEVAEMPPPALDADLTLTSGEDSPPLIAASLPPDAMLNVDLALPIAVEQTGPLPGRILVLGREPLRFEGVVRGEGRNAVRLEVPAGWLEPGHYLIEIDIPTPRSHRALRRFAFDVE